MTEPVFLCIRKECIHNDEDAYHFETHLCFVCGTEFDPTPELRVEQCDICGWYRCPDCNGCQCSLSDADQGWMRSMFETYCYNVEAMAEIEVGKLPATVNSNVKIGLGLQFYFCKRWANLKLGRCKETCL